MIRRTRNHVLLDDTMPNKPEILLQTAARNASDCKGVLISGLFLHIGTAANSIFAVSKQLYSRRTPLLIITEANHLINHLEQG